MTAPDYRPDPVPQSGLGIPQSGYAVPESGYAVPQSGHAARQPGSQIPGYGFTMQPGYQPPGYTLRPYYRTKRIPLDQPYVVRPSGWKRVLQYGVIGTLLVIVLMCGGFVTAVMGDVTPANVLVLGAFVLPVALVIKVVRIVAGGPILAVGPDGLWAKTRTTGGQAIWLPWATIALIESERLGIAHDLRIRLREQVEGIPSAGVKATLMFSDRATAETAAALRYYSAGRCEVTVTR